MVMPGKSKKNGCIRHGWVPGFFLIFFPDDETFTRNRTLLSLTSPISAALISRTRRTLTICGLFIISTTLLLFTLSTIESPTPPLRHIPSSRRLLLLHHTTDPPNSRKQSTVAPTPIYLPKPVRFFNPASTIHGNQRREEAALQGMGILYRRGTKSMPDLIVGHVKEDVTRTEFRSFIRLLHHNGLLSRSDLVLIYPSPSSEAEFSVVVEEEDESFLKLVYLYAETKNSMSRRDHPVLARYLKKASTATAVEKKKPIWGAKGHRRMNYTEQPDGLHQMNYGSLVGFEAPELDPENSLSGFFDRVPFKLRRWACYPMLLGRVRRTYKHAMLVDMKGVVILRDPFIRIRNQSPESVLLFRSESSSSKHGRTNSGNTRRQRDDPKPALSSGILVGGIRGVRRFANAVLTEIVRVSVEHKGKSRNSVSESELVHQLVNRGYVVPKKVRLVEPVELVGEANSGLNSTGLSLSNDDYYPSVVEGGVSSNFDVDSFVRTVICSTCGSYYTSLVYTDCLGPNRQ